MHPCKLYYNQTYTGNLNWVRTHSGLMQSVVGWITVYSFLFVTLLTV